MYRPLNKNVLLTLVSDKVENQQLYLGHNNTKKYQVINIGTNVTLVKENNIVLINEEKATRIVIENKEYRIIDENDIYMVVEE